MPGAVLVQMETLVFGQDMLWGVFFTIIGLAAFGIIFAAFIVFVTKLNGRRTR